MFSCLRTYVRPDSNRVDSEDRKVVEEAIENAKLRNLDIGHPIFEGIQSLLLLELPRDDMQEQVQKRYEFVMRFQQFTGPVAAKGIEDTALYRVFPLASLNEVGMNLMPLALMLKNSIPLIRRGNVCGPARSMQPRLMIIKEVKMCALV